MNLKLMTYRFPMFVHYVKILPTDFDDRKSEKLCLENYLLEFQQE